MTLMTKTISHMITDQLKILIIFHFQDNRCDLRRQSFASAIADSFFHLQLAIHENGCVLVIDNCGDIYSYFLPPYSVRLYRIRSLQRNSSIFHLHPSDFNDLAERRHFSSFAVISLLHSQRYTYQRRTCCYHPQCCHRCTERSTNLRIETTQ